MKRDKTYVVETDKGYVVCYCTSEQQAMDSISKLKNSKQCHIRQLRRKTL